MSANDGRSEAAFAQLCGTAPFPVSSGRTDRHRLNRGGDRRAYNALWRITLVRMHCHPETRLYVERRTKQGLSKLDIMRCLKLKRYIAREVYPTSPARHPRLLPLARNRRHQRTSAARSLVHAQARYRRCNLTHAAARH